MISKAAILSGASRAAGKGVNLYSRRKKISKEKERKRMEYIQNLDNLYARTDKLEFPMDIIAAAQNLCRNIEGRKNKKNQGNSNALLEYLVTSIKHIDKYYLGHISWSYSETMYVEQIHETKAEIFKINMLFEKTENDKYYKSKKYLNRLDDWGDIFDNLNSLFEATQNYSEDEQDQYREIKEQTNE